MDNVSLFFLIFGLSSKNFALDKFMIFGAEYVIYLTFLLTFILAIKGGTKERTALLLAVISLPIVVMVVKIIHLFFVEPRPFVSFNISPLIVFKADASFPSRHESIMSAIAFSYTYFKSKWATLFLFLLLWVGIARIYVGVHYPLDVLGGIGVGIVSLIIAEWIRRIVWTRLFVSQSFKS